MKQLKKRLCGILSIVMCITAMTGCAANPDRGSVTSKNNGVFEQNMTVAATAPLDEQLQYTDTFTSHDGTAEYAINFDQKMTSDPLPIVEVVPRFFTGEEVKQIAQLLFGDVDFYEREPEEDPQFSKEQLQKEINWMSSLANTEAMQELYGNDEYDYAEEIDVLKLFMQQYTVQMENAPDENPHKPCDWTFKSDAIYNTPSYGNSVIYATVDLGNVNYKIYVNRRDKNDYKLNSFSVQLGDGLGYDGCEMDYMRANLCRTSEPTEEQISALKEKAQSLLNQMGMGQWEVSSASVLKEMYGDTPEYQVLIGATPVFNNVHSIFGQPMMGLTSTDSNASNYHMTSAVFQFSANGDLIYFEMTSPVEVQTVVNEGTAILSTEELMGKVKDHLSLTGAQEAYLYGVVESWYQKPISCKIEMNRMEFGLARVKVANKDFTFYYVPAFVVYGSTHFFDAETGEEVVFPYEETAAAERALVWINAVDGSIIGET